MKQKRKIGRKLLGFLLTLAMIVGLMPGMSLTALAADDGKYREYDWNEASKTLSYEDKDIPANATELAADIAAWTDGGWYIVPEGGVTIGDRIIVTGTANLILRDGATLTASKGITVNGENTLNIYAQSAGTGELSAGNDSNAASIGGGARYESGGTVNIHGGKITATGGYAAAGIGGATDGGNGEVNIYSGEVTAQGSNFAAGIGGYSGKSGGAVSIYGGTVNASGSINGVGIGIGGTEPGSCIVNIYGGDVTASSGKQSGIQGTVNIGGGTVTANGGTYDSSLSGGASGTTVACNGISGTVTISGGTVTATGGSVTDEVKSLGGNIYACSGIGGTVTISGGTVTATGGNVTGDINNYRGGTICACNGVNGTVTISGGTVTATGGSHTGNSIGTAVKEKGFGGSLTIGDSMKVFGGDNADPTTEIEKSNDDYARFKYMLVKLGHVHSFTYEANDATIKATCSQNDCTLNDGQGNHTAILTIGAPTLNTYGQTGAGISAEATITDADNIKGTAAVVYKKGDETLASAPTDAGTYTASITLGTATASVEYTIAQKEVTVSGITASDKIYAGNTDATLVTTAAAFTGKLDGDTLTVSATGTFDNANVGENKTVTISNLTLDGTSKDNYVLAATGQQTTTTAKITAREIDLIWSNTELAYTGEAQKPTATATGVVEGDTCTVTVSGEQTNIGDNYTATAESLSNSNYKLPENKTTAFKITKADAVAATVTANNRTYDGTDKPLVNVDNSTLVGGEMRYALGENATTAPAENLYTTSIPKGTDAGTYYVWYKAKGDANHDDSKPVCVPVTISKGDTPEDKTPNVTVDYATHIQNIGWEKTVKKNGEVSGTTGRYLRLEALVAKVEGNKNLGIQYAAHVQDYGWMPWAANGELAGTSGESKRMEAIMMKLTGEDKDKYDVYYRVHVQNLGWLSWAKNGEAAGSAGYGYRLEALQIQIVPKGEKIKENAAGVNSVRKESFVAKNESAAPKVAGDETVNVSYRTHVQNVGWQGWKANGAFAGTSGRSLRLEGININLSNKDYTGGIRYKTHIQNLGWEKDWKVDGAMSGTSGRSYRLEAIDIELYGEMAEHYDVYYRVHAQNYGWMGWAKNGAHAGTAGRSLRLEGIQIVLVEKGGAAPAENLGGINTVTKKAFLSK